MALRAPTTRVSAFPRKRTLSLHARDAAEALAGELVTQVEFKAQARRFWVDTVQRLYDQRRRRPGDLRRCAAYSQRTYHPWACFERAWPVERTPCFGELLAAIDDADREHWEREDMAQPSPSQGQIRE